MASYWNNLAHRRQSRRRILALAGGVTLGSSLLAACGGDNSPAKSSLLSAPEDTTKQAKRGGTIKFYHYGDPAGFEPSFANAVVGPLNFLAYNWLFKYEFGYLKQTDLQVVPDLTESYEFSADKTQLTMKIRPGVTWHNKAPVNGRAFDVQDVIFSWERLKKVNSGRASFANEVNPDAPIMSVTAPDSTTIVMKLKQPLSYILAMLAYDTGGSFAIVPKETDTTLDLRRDILGTGPFVLDQYTPSAGLTFKRFEKYHEKDIPYADQLEMPIIPEYANRLSQLNAGNLYNSDVRGDDLLSVKQQVPDLNMYQGDLKTATGHVAFGWLPEGRSPWLDERVRQALSLSWDRDAYIDAVYNVSRFESDGLPVDTRWNTAISATFEGYWLDPKGKEFGENAKYYTYDIDETRKLLSAAGYQNGLDVVSTTPDGNAYGIDYNKNLEIIENFAREAGFRVQRNEIDYTSDFIPNFRNAKGQHEGWAQKIGPGSSTDAIGRFAYEYWSKGGDNFYGFSASGKNDMSGDPQVDALIERASAELDDEKRKQFSFELQRYLAKKAYLLMHPGGATGFDLAWPVLSNFAVRRTPAGTSTGRSPQFYWWIDDTKAPLRRI
jgi:peptide/nickel transport system substrate-binding protein